MRNVLYLYISQLHYFFILQIYIYINDSFFYPNGENNILRHSLLLINVNIP